MDVLRRWTEGRVGVIDAALGRLSPRERWLSAIAGVVLLALAASQALQWSGDQRERYGVAQAELALAQQQTAISGGGLDGFDQAQLNALTGWSQEGRNLWLVRVRIEQRIREAAEAAGMTDSKIMLAEAAEGEGGLSLLRAEVTGPYRGGPLADLLRSLSADDKAYVLDGLQVIQAGAPSFKLTLLFPVRVTPTGTRP